MTPRLRTVLTASLPLALLLVSASAPRAQTKPTTGTAPAAANASAPHMPPHYADAVHVRDAVVRGDLSAARAAAGRLGLHPEAGLPDKAAPYATAMNAAALRVGQAVDAAAAAAPAAAMLGTCGECHRALSVLPAIAAQPIPAVGETVGHMLNHRRASDQLMEGLVMPSSTAWNDGAQALRTMPITRGKLPKDPKLTPEVMAGEQRLHQLADRAAAATATPDREAVYGEMLATCASCHALHPNVWGPGKQ